MDVLDRFSPVTRAWFTASFADPTAAQAGAWQAVAEGQDVLVVAPTGSGKTLAAFLWSLDRLITQPPPDEPGRRCRVLYVSPLKALAVDVERNLRAPLAGMTQAAHRLGLPAPQVSVAIRSGDTPAAERRTFRRAPPDILITTPESLYLLLTSQAGQALDGVQTVIVDEVHAVVPTKRGAHLALSLERLDLLLPRPAQRIGLSATVRPVGEVARFLGGARPVTVVQPPSAKQVQLEVVVPVADMAALGEEEPAPASGSAAAGARRASIWPHVEERLADLVSQHRSTIVFANSRRLAERLTARLNEIAWERAGGGDSAAAGWDGAAQVMAQAGGAAGRPAVLARAHHGSVSREQRTATEEALKAGLLPAVVATSSLELGIDMGAVDLVVQVEAPPSVASGLQRVGRAGHQVGAVSHGVIFPKYRHDLLGCAVVAERMRDGSIEEMRFPRHPLDVLAQQVVAMVAMADWDVEELYDVVRRAAPYAALPRGGYEAVLDMLTGRYPSDDFAGLRPRLVWDRHAGTLSARPGAQRLAVTSGGTIPDRGLFGVFLAGSTAGRVGELDEEMVYESRVGDVFTLGSSSWRIEDITHDRVVVSPAPGQPGRLPFWKGDTVGRPVELGRAIGAFARELGRLTPDAARERLVAAGLDASAIGNLLAYLDEQRAATGHLPDDVTIVVERFRDELGDWRLAVHSPFGAPVHGPWALAVAARMRERSGVDVQAMHTDDGIVLRLPDADTAPSAQDVVLDPDEVDALVTAEVGGSALFASRFRECAARSLLLPRRDPTRRTPLWQQRQRSAQLLGVASRYASFPVVLEAVRECLQDVFDVPGLVRLMREVSGRAVRVVEVETVTPSPYARSLLLGYLGAFMYEGDSPLAERRAAALSLDSALLAELLGQADLREILAPDAVAEVEASLQHRTDERRARDLESTADLLRDLGDLTVAEAVERGSTQDWLTALHDARRAVRVRIAGQERWVAVEDAGRLRDALGVPLPPGVPEAFLEPVRDPLGDLVGRYARTRGPFHPHDLAERLGLGVAVVQSALDRLAGDGRVVAGDFRPGGSGQEWCDAQVLRRLRRRSLAVLRREAEPVSPLALARFLPVWQGVGPAAGRGTEGLLRAVDALAGAAVPASVLESLVLPGRVADYRPGLLDELMAAGEVAWAGAGALPGADGWVCLLPADLAPLLLAPPADPPDSPLHAAIRTALADGAALFFRMLADRTGCLDDAALSTAVWDLVWSGEVTNDTLAPLRALLAGAGRSRRPVTTRPAGFSAGLAGRARLPRRAAAPITSGRWSLLPAPDPDVTRRAHASAEALLARHGVLTRAAVLAERVPGGFAAVYPVLSAAEEAGRIRRGYFVAGLGGAQFAVAGAVDRLRALDPERDGGDGGWTPPAPAGWSSRPRSATAGVGTLVLAATDPANPYGAALPWPDRPDRPDGPDGLPRGASGDPPPPGGGRAGHRAGRKAGAIVVLVGGSLVLYVERGGRTLLSFTEDDGLLRPAVDALALAVREGTLGRLAVERADGQDVLGSPLAQALLAAGFHASPKGLRLRG